MVSSPRRARYPSRAVRAACLIAGWPEHPLQLLHRGQLGAHIGMQVARGSPDIRVPQQFLHGADVGAGADEVCGEGMAEFVGGNAVARESGFA